MRARRQPGAIVMGLGFSGVGALHSLAEMDPRPDPILGLDHNAKELGFASRSGRMLLAPPPWAEDGRTLRDFILELTRRHGPLVLYPCGDDYVRFLSLHRDALSPACRFLLPPAATLEALMHKERFARHARALGVPSPASAVVPARPGLSLAAGLRWPVVAKSLTSLKSDPFWGILRVRPFHGPAEWDAFFAPFAESGFEVMVQEFIPGGDDAQFVYEGLWNSEGRELLGFTVQKLRQQPAGFGSASRAEARLVPEVLEAGRRLLAGSGYCGLADVDFKLDARDGRYWAMEVNPRLGGVHRVGRSCGIELVQEMYRLLTGAPVALRVQPPDCVGQWGHFSKDLHGLLPQLPRRPLLLGPWLRSYLPPPTDALFTWADPGPFLASIARLVRASCREILAGRVFHREAAAGSGRPAVPAREPDVFR